MSVIDFDSFPKDDSSNFSKENEQIVFNEKGKKYKVSYSFGHYPLQQYLADIGNGHFQALTYSLDTKEKKWFELYSGEEFGKPFHWKEHTNNWNQRCAGCHSTNLQKNYSYPDHSYKTSFDEINVSCVSCHGPSEEHLKWSKGKKDIKHKGFSPDKFRKKKFINPKTAKGKFSLTDSKMMGRCFACHSLRGELSDDKFSNLEYLDNYIPRVVSEENYHLDGQVDNESFVMGSFTQSKMFHRGVTCLNCHNPHTGKLVKNKKKVCLQCHDTSYEKPSHTKHELGQASCIDCHMPSKTFMLKDDRVDHKFVIPRPDYSLKYGTKNSCTTCHSSIDKGELSQNFLKMYSPLKTKDDLLEIIGEIKKGNIENKKKELIKFILNTDNPEMSRAYAISFLNRFPTVSKSNLDKLIILKEYLIQRALISYFSDSTEENSYEYLKKYSKSKVKSLRMLASYSLALKNPRGLDDTDLKNLNEYLKVLFKHSDYPDNILKIALLSSVGIIERDVKSLLDLNIQRYPYFVPTYINLADYFRAINDEKNGEEILLKALGLDEKNPSIHTSLGLLYIRKKNNDKAIFHLKTAYSLNKDNAYNLYLYSVALQSLEGKAKAIEQIQSNPKQLNGSYLLLDYMFNLTKDQKYKKLMLKFK
jgi:predicted CXXCH cytochrome family protein